MTTSDQFAPMEGTFERKFFISANESNPEGELAVNILTGHLIEVATAHANSLGIGNPDMAGMNAGWVLSRLTVEMHRYPKVNTDYTVTTWVEAMNRHFSTRAFEITDEDGTTAGYARSIWMVLNTETHENFGLSHLDLTRVPLPGRQCPIPLQARHREIIEPGDAEPPKGALVANCPTRTYTFRYNDIDFYRHVNTVRYVTLLLNAFSLEEFDRNFLSRMELSFLHEGSFGETVEIMRHDNETQRHSAFSLVSRTRKTPILFARLTLSPR